MEQSKESKHLSRSDVQQKIESNIIGRISGRFGISNPAKDNKLNLKKGGEIKVDFVGKDENGLTVLGEIFVRQGKFLSGQKHKIANDVLKLISYRKDYPEVRLIVIIGCGINDDQNVDIAAFTELEKSNSWLSKAIKAWDIELVHEYLTGDEFRNLSEAVSNQKKGIKV